MNVTDAFTPAELEEAAAMSKAELRVWAPRQWIEQLEQYRRERRAGEAPPDPVSDAKPWTPPPNACPRCGGSGEVPLPFPTPEERASGYAKDACPRCHEEGR